MIADLLAVAFFLYIGGLVFGALRGMNEHQATPMTDEELRDATWAVLLWPIALTVGLLFPDKEE